MLSKDDAYSIIYKELPTGKIQHCVEYNGVFVVQVFFDDPDEGTFDPFYSVDRTTGAFSDFSIITDGDPKVLDALFKESQRR